MKIKSNSKNNIVLAANGKPVRHDGVVYKIIAQQVGPLIFADAEPFTQGERINLFSGTKTAKEIRKLVETGIVS